jgi:hypothetical protein
VGRCRVGSQRDDIGTEGAFRKDRNFVLVDKTEDSVQDEENITVNVSEPEVEGRKTSRCLE